MLSIIANSYLTGGLKWYDFLIRNEIEELKAAPMIKLTPDAENFESQDLAAITKAIQEEEFLLYHIQIAPDIPNEYNVLKNKIYDLI